MRGQIDANLQKLQAEQDSEGRLLTGGSVQLVGAKLQNRMKELIEAENGNLTSMQVLPVQEEKGFQRISMAVNPTAPITSLQKILYPVWKKIHSPYLFIEQFLQLMGDQRFREGAEQEQTDQLQVHSKSLDLWHSVRMINSPKNSPGVPPPKPRIGGPLLSLTALAALLAFEVLEGPFFVPEVPPSGQPRRALATTGALPVEASDLSAFDEIVARPLFSPTRRPPPARQQTVTATACQAGDVRSDRRDHIDGGPDGPAANVQPPTKCKGRSRGKASAGGRSAPSIPPKSCCNGAKTRK